MINHPRYESILKEVLSEQYNLEQFKKVSEKAKDHSHAQALYIQARLTQLKN